MVPHAPDIAGLMREAVAHLRSGQFVPAEHLLRQALVHRASDPDVQYALGVAPARQGRLAEAVPHLEMAAGEAPGNPGHWMTALDVLRALGDLEGQARLYQAFFRIQPGNAVVHHRYGNVLREMNRPGEAEEAWRAALVSNPNFAPAHTNLGVAAKLRGDLRSAEREYRQALANEPDDQDSRRYLGGVMCEQGRLDEALELFMEHAQRRYGAGIPPAEPVAQHKRLHDREQQAWLGVPETDANKFSIMGGARLAGPVINSPDVNATENLWKAAGPPMVVVDDFLTPPALEELRRFCLGSTIWHQSFPGGYLGALPEHGFAVPLLAQLGEELAASYPAIFAGRPLLQLWAFKYGRTPTGIRLHADFAAVNVNFWITPDSANRNPDRGGLVIWDKAAPQDWDFEKYNNDEGAIRSFLQQSGSKATTVPYRANRAVIFDSDLFHETDLIDFAEGYENHRINITLLYGWRGGAKRTD